MTFFGVAMYKAKFNHRDFKVYKGRVDKTPHFPYFYYQERDPPVPLDMRQGGTNSCRTNKISTDYGETQIRAEKLQANTGFSIA
jgi:hypothetical protein